MIKGSLLPKKRALQRQGQLVKTEETLSERPL
jgi:hypothetical protein